MSPKPAQALHEAADAGAAVIALFPAKPVVVQKTEPPAYLRFANAEPNAYKDWQHAQQRAQLLESTQAQDSQQSAQAQQERHYETWQPMICPWSIAGRKVQP